jgi:protein ImuB
MKKYAVLFAPEFRLQATLRHTPSLAKKPAALLEVEGTKSRVSERNASARRSRVEQGMTPTQALARCPDLCLLHGNAGHERSAREILLQTAETLSPFLEWTQPGAVTVELPQEKEFREESLQEKVIASLRTLGLETQVGTAGTPGLALLAARLADPVQIVEQPNAFLAPLPLAVLQPSDELAHILEMWGIRTIGQLVALPRGPASDRLGPEAVHLWELATGGSIRPLDLVKSPEHFVEQADLDNPVEMLKPLLFLLRRFLEQIVARLEQVYLAVGKLRLTLRFEEGDSYRRLFVVPQPTRDVSLLFRMLHTHLENFTSTAPIVGLELAALPVRATSEQLGLLDRGLRDPHQFAETLARLQALLGSDRVGTPEIEASHHPDAFHVRPHEVAVALRATEESESGVKKLRCTECDGYSGSPDLFGIPWLRFRPPIPANIILNETQPAFLYSSRSTGPVREARGPWLLEGDWWEKAPWTRCEWDIVTEDGVYRLVQSGADWFLDGIYA